MEILFKTPFKSDATIEIFNIDGKRCYSEPIYSMDRIIKTNLPPGFYVAKISDNLSIYTQKIVIVSK
ncbi:MAG: T9SS type A sorting domain-containing protein [Bacteroidetes bacterium]|nr:T9SS type A sorting domain-containing protein [Bacteroidota bacterium]